MDPMSKDQMGYITSHFSCSFTCLIVLYYKIYSETFHVTENLLPSFHDVFGFCICFSVDLH